MQPDDEPGFTLVDAPRKFRSTGPALDTRIIRSGDAMLRLIEEYDVDLTDLAAIAGIDLSVASRRVDDARERRARCPHAPKFTGSDTRYFAKRYADTKDPAIKAWLKGLNTRRRKRA